MSRRAVPFAVITLVGAVWLHLAGRNLICPCGRVAVWDGWPAPGENSQHLFDWFTLSHIIHGFAFHGLLWLVARRVAFGWRLAVATAIEVAWEIVENSATVIEHYRSNTVSVDYNGVRSSIRWPISGRCGWASGWRAGCRSGCRRS